MLLSHECLPSKTTCSTLSMLHLDTLEDAQCLDQNMEQSEGAGQVCLPNFRFLSPTLFGFQQTQQQAEQRLDAFQSTFFLGDIGPSHEPSLGAGFRQSLVLILQHFRFCPSTTVQSWIQFKTSAWTRVQLRVLQGNPFQTGVKGTQ